MRKALIAWLRNHLDDYLQDALAYLAESGLLLGILSDLSPAGRRLLRDTLVLALQATDAPGEPTTTEAP